MGLIAKKWKVICPKCGTDESIDIAVRQKMGLNVLGLYELPPKRSDVEWDGDCAARCRRCGYRGTFRDLGIAYRDLQETL
jgi:predicted nucleic-acid-binding Zn-ribbon protein